MNKSEEFESHRALLTSIAYRLLGSVSEAEDAVQEAWLRFDAAQAQPRSPKSYLAAVVTRVCIDAMRSTRRRRETYPGPWFPEPLTEDPYHDPERSAELADSVSMSALLLLERLTPAERAVFVLHEVFGFSFGEIAASIGRSEVTCRQLAVRARRRMDERRPRFDVDSRKRRELTNRFIAALKEGDVDGLRSVLAADVLIIGDGGGKVAAWAGGVAGRERVEQILTSIVPGLLRIGGQVCPTDLNGDLGVVFRNQHGDVLTAWTLEVLDEQIQTIRSVLNPDKLRHLGAVADMGQVQRAVRRARSQE